MAALSVGDEAGRRQELDHATSRSLSCRSIFLLLRLSTLFDSRIKLSASCKAEDVEGRLARTGDVVLPSFVNPDAENEIQETAGYFRILPISDFLHFAEETYKDTQKDPHRNYREAQKFRPSEQYFGSVNIIDDTVEKKLRRVTTESATSSQTSGSNVFQPSFFNREPLPPIIEDNSSYQDDPSNQSSLTSTTANPFKAAQPADPVLNPTEQSSISPVAQSKSGLFDFKIPPKSQQQSNFLPATHQTDFAPSSSGEHSASIGSLPNNGFLLTPEDHNFANFPEIEHFRPDHLQIPNPTTVLYSTQPTSDPYILQDLSNSQSSFSSNYGEPSRFQLTDSYNSPNLQPDHLQIPNPATVLYSSQPNINTPQELSNSESNFKSHHGDPSRFQLRDSNDSPNIQQSYFPQVEHPGVPDLVPQNPFNEPTLHQQAPYIPHSPKPPTVHFATPTVRVQEQNTFSPYHVTLDQSPKQTLSIPRRKGLIGGQGDNNGIIPRKQFGPSDHPNHLPPVATSSSYGSSDGKLGYNYAYSVDGGSYGPAFHKQEERKGEKVEGEYSVRLPDGRLQRVEYTVRGKEGYRAKVSYH